MVCKMVKKGVVGAALTAGALYLAFGTSAPSYVKTAFFKARHSVKASVPIEFDIDVARQEIAQLEPSIEENKETVARGEVDVEQLEKEIATWSRRTSQPRSSGWSRFVRACRVVTSGSPGGRITRPTT